MVFTIFDHSVDTFQEITEFPFQGFYSLPEVPNQLVVIDGLPFSAALLLASTFLIHSLGGPGLDNPLDNVRKRFIEEGEVQKILPELAPDVRAVVTIPYHTGMRLGEILELRWKNVDLERRIFLFEGEKTGQERAVALHPEVIQVLQALPRGINPGVTLFRMRRERAERHWRRVCKKLGIENARIHDLRGTRATIWHKEKGLSQDLTMSMSGHKTDSMFRRYQITSTKYVEQLAQEWAQEETQAENESSTG